MKSSKRVIPPPQPRKPEGGAQRAATRQKVAAQRAARPTAAFVEPGQQASGLGSNPSVRVPGRDSRVPVVRSNQFTVRGMSGGFGFAPENWPQAAASVASMAGGSVASAVRLIRGVPTVVKAAQRALSAEMRESAGKGTSMGPRNNLTKDQLAELRSGYAQRAFDDAMSPSASQQLLRRDIADLMRTEKGPLRIVRKPKNMPRGTR